MDFVVRHGLPGTPNRLTTNGGRRRGCAEDREGWVLLALWFDAPRRKTLGRLTTNGVGPRYCAEDRSGLGADTGLPGTAQTGWVPTIGSEAWVLCGSTRPSEDSRSAHHERGGADDWLGGLGAGGCVVRHDRPKTPGRLTTNGVGPTIGSEAWVLWPVWFDTTVRRLPVGSPRTGWGPTKVGSDTLGWGRRLARRGCCVVRHDRPKTAGRLTTNGVGPASLGGYWNVRPGVSRPGCRARPVGGGRLPGER